jgi:DNA modification methylase
MNKNQWLQLVGGKWCNEDGSMGEASIDGAKMCWIPGKGKIYVHGLRHEVEEILKATGREAEIPESQGNNHPTVKPIELMKYLIKLITPPGGTVLDPFNGSGSTGCAAVELGYEYIGCELDPAYVAIAQKRIEAWYQHTHKNNFDELFSSNV